jgi:hypothetical protein
VVVRALDKVRISPREQRHPRPRPGEVKDEKAKRADQASEQEIRSVAPFGVSR